MKKAALGKGLGALIGEEVSAPGKPFEEIDIQLLDTDQNQPRKNFNPEKLEELAQSIRTHGVMQPLLVVQNGSRYTIIAGERRYRAARLAGLSTLPVIVKNLSDKDILEISLIENIQREDLNAIEQAEALKTLMENYSLTQDEIAKRVGKSRSAIANLTRLISLPAEIKQLVQKGALSAGHARALLPLDDPKRIAEAAHLVVSREFSVRQTEEYIRKLLATPAYQNKTPQRRPPELDDAQKTLSELFDTKVSLSGSLKNGKIVIEYYSKEQLETIYDKLLVK
jgi:ParB family chromosome partitioning protein